MGDYLDRYMKAQEAVDKILDDLTSRKGLRHEWDDIDEDIQKEITEEWISIVMSAMK